MTRRIAIAITALAVLALATAQSAAAQPEGPRYYLSLGDSLSQGFQPGVNGGITGMETNEGYVDDLFARLQKSMPRLQLVKLGCPGESTGSMIKGSPIPRRRYNCNQQGGSQLAAAVRFLRAHHTPGQVSLVTIDIGANDVDNCATPASNVIACVTAGEAAIQQNVPIILSRLKKAAPAGTVFAGMTLYDPILGGYFSTDPTAHGLAIASQALAQQLNARLTNLDQQAGFRTADVAGAFSTYDSTTMVPFNGQQIPLNVARVCSWTWACTTPPSGPDIHANRNGYQVIAKAFLAVLKGVL